MAIVGFARPTSSDRVVCQYMLRGDCRFGESCRSSHGNKTHVFYKREYFNEKARLLRFPYIYSIETGQRPELICDLSTCSRSRIDMVLLK